jgi:hypothetical protein
MNLLQPSVKLLVFVASVFLADVSNVDAFFVDSRLATTRNYRVLADSQATSPQLVTSTEEATQLLSEWDRNYSADSTLSSWSSDFEIEDVRGKLPHAIKCLNEAALQERSRDTTLGRVMLGICASSAEEGLATLKSWVSALELPRGLLHGMDKDGVPLKLEGAVYMKYNTGGSLTFTAIRKSGVGFDAIWKPGDAMLELYDGTYRGVYFQAELSDGVFRQFLVPLDTFDVAQPS